MAFFALDNPVMRAELRHQRQVIQSSRSGWFWIVLALGMVVPALLTAIILIAAALLGVDVEAAVAAPALSNIAQIGIASLLIVNFALYVVVTLVTHALAASSINREYDSRTWESLLLTHMTARQIVQGKCWATLRALWGDHLLVLTLRLGFVAYLDFLGSDPDLPQPSRLLAGLLVVAIFTVADSILSVILGILPPVSGRNPVVLALVMGLRMIVSLAILGLSIGIGLLVHEWNGLLVGAVIGGMALYVAAAAGMLRFAEWAAVRNLASPVARLSHK